MHGDSADSIRPNSIRHTDLELIRARWGVLLDDQETCSFVQDEVTGGKNKQTDAHVSLRKSDDNNDNVLMPFSPLQDLPSAINTLQISLLHVETANSISPQKQVTASTFMH